MIHWHTLDYKRGTIRHQRNLTLNFGTIRSRQNMNYKLGYNYTVNKLKSAHPWDMGMACKPVRCQQPNIPIPTPCPTSNGGADYPSPTPPNRPAVSIRQIPSGQPP